MRRRRSSRGAAVRPVLMLAAVAAGLAGSTLLACGDDGQVRLPFDAPDADGNAVADASLPPVSDAGPLDTGVDAERPAFDAAAEAVQCDASICMTRIVAGRQHYCAVATDGVVRCWGLASAIGDAANTAPGEPGATPVVIEGIRDVTDISADSLHTCAVVGDGGVVCWGGYDTPTPTTDPKSSNPRGVATGDDRRCEIRASGELFCWGDSYALGTGDSTMDLGGEKAAGVALGQWVGLALTETGKVYSWGFDPVMLGRDTPLAKDDTSRIVTAAPPLLQIAVASDHACGVSVDGRLLCWGHGDKGGLGVGSLPPIVTVPAVVPFVGPARAGQVAVSGSHTCARMTDGTLDCWAADNVTGKLGFEANDGVYVPTKVEGLPLDVVSVATGDESTCALLVDGSVHCWGDNRNGQLGLGTHDDRRHPTPTPVVFP